MPLWGTTASSAANKPKHLTDDEDSDYNIANSYATESGWVMRAGTPASGNDNPAAQPEVLVAIGGLDTTLSGATVTDADLLLVQLLLQTLLLVTVHREYYSKSDMMRLLL